MSLTGENGTQLTMPVMPAGGMGGYGMGGFGGDGWWGILFLIAIMCGGWGGFGGGTQAALTRGELCQDMNFQSLENGVRGIQQGLCDGFYAMQGSINGIGTTVMQGFSQAELSRCNQQAALMQQLYQIGYNQQDCCCQTKGAIERSNYDAAIRSGTTDRLIERGFCDTIQAGHNDADRILARLDAMERGQDKAKIAEQAAEIQAYKQTAAFGAMIDASRAEILRRTGNDCPVNAYVVQPPQPVSFATNCSGQATFNNGYGYGNCGCNSGCNCG